MCEGRNVRNVRNVEVWVRGRARSRAWWPLHVHPPLSLDPPLLRRIQDAQLEVVAGESHSSPTCKRHVVTEEIMLIC